MHELVTFSARLGSTGRAFFIRALLDNDSGRMIGFAIVGISSLGYA